MTFDQWIVELKRIAEEQFGFTDEGIAHTQWEAFKTYFDDGYTPLEALREDFSYA